MEPPSSVESKPYHCSVCGDDFKRHEHLIRHSRRHTQEKPFKCDVCQKEFARRDILSRHAIVHVPAAERAALPQKAQKRGTKRVQQACNNCAKGKCRCDGETPCSTCQSKGLENCEYTLSTTPAKRRRADSSASTAAANVLLQVASSAHASPKGDWTMDYNGQHGDVSMQPPALVYGFTPSLNGGMNHDAFIYGSKPGSRFASRAPSPSHEFDGPFENAFPTPSMFGFLFKESARDLPAINSILPGLLPTPAYPGEFAQRLYGHNGIEQQPGTYSDYRSDSMANSNPAFNAKAPQPPSLDIVFPDVSIPDTFQELEDQPLVESYTEEDRAYLCKYAELDAPPTRLLNIFLQLYFDKFNVSLPIIHRASYKYNENNLVLTLAMMTLGSHYMETAGDVQQPLSQLARRALNVEQDTFTALQAAFLLDMADLYSVQSQSSLEAVEEHRIALLRNARAKALFDENYGDAPPEGASTALRWMMAQQAEERRRLSWAIFLYDHFFKVFFNARPLLKLEEIKTSLPCHESLWETNSADEWAAQFAPDLMPLRTRTLLGTGRLEERGVEECGHYGTFCRTILAHVEARRVQDIGDQQPADSKQGVVDGSDLLYESALAMSAGAFDVLDKVLTNGSETASAADQSDAVLNLQFARLTTLIDLRIIRQYLFGDDARIRTWAVDSQSRARASALSAAHIFKLLVERQASPFAGIMALYATTILFCFAKYYREDSAMQRLQLDQQEFSSPQAQQWIKKGDFLPLVHDIGLLNNENVPRITSSWDRSDIAFWAVETLQQRIEALAEFE